MRRFAACYRFTRPAEMPTPPPMMDCSHSFHDGALTPLRGLVFRHRNNGAGERTVGLSQLIQNREVIGVGDRYQVAWDMPLRPVGMVIAAARDHGRQLAGAVGDTQRLVDDRPPHW